MSNARRPSTTRRPATKKSKADKQKALDQGIKVTVAGVDYSVRLGDLSALDSLALRRELGVSFMGLMRQLNDDPDIDSIAAIVWLRRRIDGEIVLPYESVAADFSYDTEFDIEEAEPETNPEA